MIHSENSQVDKEPTEPQKKLSRRGAERYKENPFISHAAVNTKTGVKRINSKNGDKMLVINKGSGEVMAEGGFWHTQEVDKSQFVKLFINGVKALKELTNAGTKVFEIMYMQVQENISKDVINLHFVDIDQELTPMARATFNRGLSELIDKGFLAETLAQSRYFINPDFIWNGDRLTFVREFRMQSTKTPKDQADRNALEAKGQTRLIE